MKIILASASKRRQELLKMINIKYEIMKSDIDETFDDKLNIIDNCALISYKKGLEILNKTKNVGDRIIISCDTIVVKNNKVYGKPINRENAFYMLKELSNSCHEVISCLTILVNKDNELNKYSFSESCKVYIDSLSELEINKWLDKGQYDDKAGAYAIQEEFGKHINKIDGDYYTIVGLPLNKLYNILKEFID